jgi:YHS domain-containing protein
MRPVLLAALFAVTPVVASAHETHSSKGEHASAPRSFDHKPATGTWARCPVSGEVFQVGPDTEFTTYQGRTYAFCCPDCKTDFAKDSSRYADRG